MFLDYWYLALLSGFFVLLTPCVFPLLPLMFSSFLGENLDLSEEKIRIKTTSSRVKVIIFVVVIWILFVGTALLGSSLFAVINIYSWSTHPIWNLFLGGICLFFAANLLGLFELHFPAALLQKIYIKEQATSRYWLNSILLALLFISTTFTCTAPFIGTLLLTLPSYQNLFEPILYFWLFSLGLTSPFIFFIIFPNLGKKIRIFGGNLVLFKQTFGIIELCVAIKFFSNADLVWQLGFLSREIVLSLWLSIILFWSILISIKGEFILRNNQRSIFHFTFAIIFIFMIIHIALLEFQQKSHWLSPYLPPLKINGNLQMNAKSEVSLLIWHEDIEKARQLSLKTNRMIFINFTGFTCINCRWMDENIFRNTDVQELLTENFILVKLYTDALEEKYQRNQKLQYKLVNNIALPYYLIVDADLDVLFQHAGLERDVSKFIGFLTEFIDNNYLLE